MKKLPFIRKRTKTYRGGKVKKIYIIQGVSKFHETLKQAEFEHGEAFSSILTFVPMV
jgi:hypothetical protein